MKSIQSKFILLISSALLTLALLIGGFSVWNTNAISIHDSELMMDAVCNEQALKLDMQLQSIEQAVMTIYNCAKAELVESGNVQSEETFVENVKRVQGIALDIAQNTKGARTVYFKVNSDFSQSTDGFFLVKKTEESQFMENYITDVSLYDENDVEHVGWYYEPIKAGKAIWMHPYYNKNIDIEMISYVVPLLKDGTVIGVIGMDIDFTLFVDLAQEAAVYEGGRANLIDMGTKQIFYREKGDDEKTVRVAEITVPLFENLSKQKESGANLTFYKSHDNDYLLAFQTVQNGMKYILYSPIDEINRKRNSLFAGILWITFGSLLLFIVYTIYMTRKIIRPLELLTEATTEIADGNWDVHIECHTKDEVKTLADSIQAMADNLRHYVSEINKLAYKDGLTGVKNKTCYNDYVKVITQDADATMKPYAVMVFDVNNLKLINDNYGHETGDKLLISACQCICRVYAHSPVFRIGGDEFVAILEGEDYNNRMELQSYFERELEKSKLEVPPYCAIQVAYGMGEHSEENSDYDMVFRCADHRMYEKKRKMKKEYII